MDKTKSEWAVPGLLTELKIEPAMLDQLPGELPELCKLVQGLLSNVFWMEELDDDFDETRLQDVDLRSAHEILSRVIELDPRPLHFQRPSDKKVVSNARSYGLLLTALLRKQGVPARLRCGFSTYFKPGLYIEHWGVEVWLPEENRWVLVDPQLDAEQQENFSINFSPYDVPGDAFIKAPEAWQLCRADEQDPDIFGLYEYTGMWFIRGSLIRDFLALRKIELLPWDSFGLIAKEEEELEEEDLALLDGIARITVDEDLRFPEVSFVYDKNQVLQPPAGM